jgi:hypothetical protein
MNRYSIPGLATLLAIVWMAASCTSSPAPKDPLWDRESCAHCSMSVSEHRYATQIIGPGVTVRHYDDLGCALRDRERKPELQQGKLYVRPHGMTSWVPAEEARYTDGLRTPMGHGYGPVASEGHLSLAEVEAVLLKGGK